MFVLLTSVEVPRLRVNHSWGMVRRRNQWTFIPSKHTIPTIAFEHWFFQIKFSELKSILFKNNLEKSSSHKDFLNWAAYLRAGGTQIFGPIEEIFVARWIFQVIQKKNGLYVANHFKYCKINTNFLWINLENNWRFDIKSPPLRIFSEVFLSQKLKMFWIPL